MKTIKFYIMLACSIMAASTSYAQGISNTDDAATVKGDVLVDIGIGLIGGDYRGYDPRSYGTTYWNYSDAKNKIQVPTMSVSVQKAWWDDITIGGQVAFNIFGSEHDVRDASGYYQHSNYTQSNTYILSRGEYHFGRLVKWPRKYDLYAGVLAGARITHSLESHIYEGWGNGQPGTYRIDYPNNSSTDVGPDGGLFGGVRYYFTGSTSVYAEAGFGITAIRAGLAWRL